MLIIYNILQWCGLILFAPLIFVKTVITPKYRLRILRRLGLGFDRLVRQMPPGRPRIWFHALSVGEVLSSQPLVRAVRATFPGATLIFSASTKTGEQLAHQSFPREIDLFVPYPLDLLFVVNRFLDRLSPDLFILVETDFWPNFLNGVKAKQIDAMLVNGRISRSSFRRYRRFAFFFLPMFGVFRLISMQTDSDTGKMIELGVRPERVQTLGNLKYDSAIPSDTGRRLEFKTGNTERQSFGIHEEQTIWVAGSTHPGEEKIILDVYKRLSLLFPDLFLIVAPRQVERSGEITAMAARHGLPVRRRREPATDGIAPAATVLVLDTMGELPAVYSFCDLAFIGGSLVPDGGHNPLEAAAFGKPVLFGPHMEDFGEISRDLLDSKGAVQVADSEELYDRLQAWLSDPGLRRTAGGRARELVDLHQGVTARHLREILRILT